MPPIEGAYVSTPSPRSETPPTAVLSPSDSPLNTTLHDEQLRVDVLVDEGGFILEINEYSVVRIVDVEQSSVCYAVTYISEYLPQMACFQSIELDQEPRFDKVDVSHSTVMYRAVDSGHQVYLFVTNHGAKIQILPQTPSVNPPFEETNKLQ